MLTDLLLVQLDVICNGFYLVKMALADLQFHFFDQLGIHFGKVVHKVERVLDLMGNAGSKLSKRGHFFRLYQLPLGDFQFWKRLLQHIICFFTLAVSIHQDRSYQHKNRNYAEHYVKPDTVLVRYLFRMRLLLTLFFIISQVLHLQGLLLAEQAILCLLCYLLVVKGIFVIVLKFIFIG